MTGEPLDLMELFRLLYEIKRKRAMRDDEIRERNEAVQEANGLVNPAPRRLTLREQNDQLRRELQRLQEDRQRGQPFLDNAPIAQVPIQPPPRQPHQWWTEPVAPQPPPQGHRHNNVVEEDPWNEVDTAIVGATVAAELRRGNHGARIEHGDMKDVALKQPEPPDIMGKLEDHFL